MKILTDILKKTKDGVRRFSQSRIYLLLCLTILLSILISQLFVKTEIEHLVLITDNLFYLIVLFSTYALGEKGIDTFSNYKK